MELMERLAALVPPPRFNITRFYGVLAPTATFRPLIVPNDKTTIPPTHQDCPGKAATPITDASKTDRKRSRQPKKLFLGSLDDAGFRAGRSLLSTLRRTNENLMRHK
jgi:hypothetical protein